MLIRFKTRLFALLILLLGMSHPLSAAVTFTKVTTGPIPASEGDSRSANFIDYDNDGDLDLYITNGPSTADRSFLYRNDGGTFTEILTDTIAKVRSSADGASFVDADNDGDLDAFVATWYGQNDLYYTGNGDGTFTRTGGNPIVTSGGHGESGSWADYDSDGDLDLYVCNSGGAFVNFLFRNDDSAFTRILTGGIVTEADRSRIGAWGDYDNDGDADLFIANEANQHDDLFRNDAGSFTKITAVPLVSSGGDSFSSSWGDYDNDLDLDLIVINNANQNEFLWQNNGNGTFTRILTGPVVNSAGYGVSSIWADLDNDADLDLYVTNAFAPSAVPNFLFWNDGAGNFTQELAVTPVTDLGWTYGAAVGDVDHDGDLDLALAKCLTESEAEALYLNDGNGNSWLEVLPEGVESNRSAVGARIKIKATIGGTPKWQMREISSQDGYASQNGLRAHFGLGDATIIDSLVITWPSGAVTRQTNVPVNQRLFVQECVPGDPDGDGILCTDNCPSVPNLDQLDTNNDGIGDACCCMGTTGNVDADPLESVDIADLTVLVDHLFLSFTPLDCPNEGNCDGLVGVDIGDLTSLVDHLFISFGLLAVCP